MSRHRRWAYSRRDRCPWRIHGIVNAPVPQPHPRTTVPFIGHYNNVGENRMTDKKTVGSVTYQNAGKDYFEKRALKRHARVWSLWALGVGAVISGHFSGWNL